VAKLKANYLSLTGYRLPTEAEWEYACRAGAVTARSYGETDELLGHYGSYLLNSSDRTWPVRSKKPNDWGLFDLHGNVACWCQESYREYGRGRGDGAINDLEDKLSIDIQQVRVLRGGSFGDPARNVRSANRNGYAPTIRFSFVGLRPARTFTP
jgi:formylglycine-generating enzyme required for sulfatase activity